MRRRDLIICYDISNTKRLSRVARFLEKEAIRIQYSVFIAPECDKKTEQNIKERLAELIDSEEDDVRIYHMAGSGIHLGQGIDLDDALLLIDQ